MESVASGYRWVWVDLESGVPALFGLNPLPTLMYYIPRSVAHGECLFDTVNTFKLSFYLDKNKSELVGALGDSAYEELLETSTKLAKAQKNWKGIKRFRRSLFYALSQKKISPEKCEYYKIRGVQWTFVVMAAFLLAFVLGVTKLPLGIFNWFRTIKIKKSLGRFYRYFSSSLYRWGVARWSLKKDVNKWFERKVLTKEEKDHLLNELHKNGVSSCLMDFSIHLAVKPLDKAFIYGLMPFLIVSKVISVEHGALIMILSGSTCRTLYTLWRFSHSLVRARPYYPFTALFIGLLPGIGNLAYPAELIVRSSAHKDVLARFIMFDLSAKIGRRFPLWGGKDSGLEHFCVRLVSRCLGGVNKTA
jgi:hypothetical protein